MPLKWKIFRIICVFQMLSSSVLTIMAIVRFFEAKGFYTAIVVILFVLVFLLSLLAINILGSNYPDKPITGRQKNNFNRLFLLNFLFLVFLFGIIFAEWRDLRAIANLTGQPMLNLPSRLFFYLGANLLVLILQLTMFYGLYHLRLELYRNFMKDKFDFEKSQP
jgi:hypothetical protein